jgi:hypothetical protein
MCNLLRKRVEAVRGLSPSLNRLGRPKHLKHFLEERPLWPQAFLHGEKKSGDAMLMLPFSVLGQGSPALQADRIRGSIDPNSWIVLIHPKARPENDRSAVSQDLNLDYVTLDLKLVTTFIIQAQTQTPHRVLYPGNSFSASGRN